jgi:hypothetical protein
VPVVTQAMYDLSVDPFVAEQDQAARPGAG